MEKNSLNLEMLWKEIINQETLWKEIFKLGNVMERNN